MIYLQKKCGWELVFQAANIDTAFEADRLGINEDKAMSFIATNEGVNKMMMKMCATISDVRQKPNKKNK